MPVRRLLALGASMVVAASLAIGGSASAADQPLAPAPELAPIGGLDVSSLPTEAEAATVTPQPASPRANCISIPASKRSALGGATKECVKSKALTDVAAVPAARAASEFCDITQPGKYTGGRFGLCLSGLELTHTLLNDKGAVVGTGVMNVATDMTLSATSTTWSETVTVQVVKVTGELKSLTIAYDVGCTSGCTMTKATPWTGSKILGQGGMATGTVTYSAPVAAGGQTQVTSQHHMYVVATGGIPLDPNVNWTNPYPIRCDAQIGSNPGCVIPAARANMVFSLAKFGGAAFTYGWTQNNLRANAPLTRDPSEAAAEIRRANTCETSADPFVYMFDVVPNDSCDEFPFARSYEGGTNGGLCADVLPLYVDGEWEMFQARADKPVTFTEPCVRSHVDLDDNTNAGGELGRQATSQRVLDTEKYNVVVTL